MSLSIRHHSSAEEHSTYELDLYPEAPDGDSCDKSQSESSSIDDGDQAPEPRGEGSAVPPADGPGDAPDRTPGGFWATYVSCEVDFSEARDHLANERTFLGYLRTSVMMSMVGTLVLQLFTLNHHGAGFGYTLVGKPLATTCYAFSAGTVILGAVRSWRHQDSMLRGMALAGGFEVHVLGICSMLVGAYLPCKAVGNEAD
ncbi:hypothetical protein ACJ41O_001746 [Fusarium nematophilum]